MTVVSVITMHVVNKKLEKILTYKTITNREVRVKLRITSMSLSRIKATVAKSTQWYYFTLENLNQGGINE